MTPTPAAPSGELPDDYERWDGLREAVSDFRKATYEFARGQRPEDNDAMMAAQRRIFTEARAAVSQAEVEQAMRAELIAARDDLAFITTSFENSSPTHQRAQKAYERIVRALAAPSGAPKQPTSDLRDTLIELANTQRKLIDANAEIALYQLAAASTVQSAPVLPERGIAGRHDASFMVLIGHLIHASQEIRDGAVWPLDGMILAHKTGEEMRVLDDIVNNALQLASDLRKAAQSTPVQVDGQQASTIDLGYSGKVIVQPSCDSALRAEPGSQPVSTGAKMITLDDPELDASNSVTRFFLLAEYWKRRYRALRTARHLDADAILKLWRDCGCAVNDGNAIKFARAIESELASRCRAQGGIDEPDGAVQAVALPVAAAPEQCQRCWNTRLIDDPHDIEHGRIACPSCKDSAPEQKP